MTGRLSSVNTCHWWVRWRAKSKVLRAELDDSSHSLSMSESFDRGCIANYHFSRACSVLFPYLFEWHGWLFAVRYFDYWMRSYWNSRIYSLHCLRDADGTVWHVHRIETVAVDESVCFDPNYTEIPWNPHVSRIGIARPTIMTTLNDDSRFAKQWLPFAEWRSLDRLNSSSRSSLAWGLAVGIDWRQDQLWAVQSVCSRSDALQCDDWTISVRERTTINNCIFLSFEHSIHCWSDHSCLEDAAHVQRRCLQGRGSSGEKEEWSEAKKRIRSTYSLFDTCWNLLI